jgi:tocopherol cyclase
MAFKNTLHPNRYHGFSKKAPFFEGWYYKLVSADEQHRLAIIPGVYLASEQEKQHCFVQVFDSNDAVVRYHRYPYAAFQAAPDAFAVQVGPNRFLKDKISLAIDDEIGKVEGELAFEGLNPWPVNIFSPGAMGWFAWVPMMECYHGVVSMDHTIQGKLSLDGREVDFSGGRGYIEKDWGKQFPSAWIWGQSNHFEQPGVSLMVSVAVIPWVGRSFGGFIIGFLHDGVIHRFATYNGGKIEQLSIEDDAVNLVVRNRTRRLSIRALRVRGGLLQAPTMVEMDRRIIETLDAQMQVRFEDRSGGCCLRERASMPAWKRWGSWISWLEWLQKVKSVRLRLPV